MSRGSGVDPQGAELGGDAAPIDWCRDAIYNASETDQTSAQGGSLRRGPDFSFENFDIYSFGPNFISAESNCAVFMHAGGPCPFGTA